MLAVQWTIVVKIWLICWLGRFDIATWICARVIKQKYLKGVTAKCLLLTRLRLVSYMLASLTANASRETASSGGGESANIYALILDNTPVTDFSYGSLPCKSPSRTVYCRLAVHRLSSGSTNSVIVFRAPLTRTHCPPPPYCLSSLPRSIDHTTHTSPRSTTCFDSADWILPTYRGSLLPQSSVRRREAGQGGV